MTSSRTISTDDYDPEPREQAWSVTGGNPTSTAGPVTLMLPSDLTYHEAMARQILYLQGCLTDLQSAYDEIAQALAVSRGGGPCGACGVLQAHLAACTAEIIEVRSTLLTLDGLICGLTGR